jgi:AAA domain (dynein-related subfamily)
MSNTAQKIIAIPPSELRDSLLALARARRPGCTYGSPGIGKSEIHAQVADELFAAAYGYTVDSNGRLHDDTGQLTDERPYLVDVRVALMDPVDLMGRPGVKNGDSFYERPPWFPTDERGGIVLLDEITRGTKMVQNALLQFTLNRRLGENKLPQAWLIFAASNREEDGGGITRLNSALSERFIRLDLEPDLDEWGQWALLTGIHPLIRAYLRFRPEHFNTFDPDELVNVNPRSWFFASEIVYAAPAKHVEMALFAGTLGRGVGSEVVSFLDIYRQCPSVDAILLNPDTAPVPGPLEASALFAIASALQTRMIEDPSRADTIAIYLERMPTDYQAMTWKEAVVLSEGLAHTTGFTTFVTRHPEIF